MQEYKDGSFGEIIEGKSKLKKLLDNDDEMGKTRSIHFGTKEELLNLRKRISRDAIRQRVEFLEKTIDDLSLQLNEICVKLGLRTDEILRVSKL